MPGKEGVELTECSLLRHPSSVLARAHGTHPPTGRQLVVASRPEQARRRLTHRPIEKRWSAPFWFFESSERVVVVALHALAFGDASHTAAPARLQLSWIVKVDHVVRLARLLKALKFWAETSQVPRDFGLAPGPTPRVP